ncbi:MAG: hypothetical protein EOP04_04075 [Proteobacteria bacterium]|nr:MAG: hypothetical protein EOP04_04075 [Pseudomonadota bacterium]
MQKSRTGFVRAIVSSLGLILTTLLVLSSQALLATDALELRLINVIGSSKTDKICSGVWIAPNKVLTSRHCLLTQDPSAYRVMLPNSPEPVPIEKIEWLADSFIFPNLDLAVLHIKPTNAKLSRLGFAVDRKDAKFFYLKNVSAKECFQESCRKYEVANLREIDLLDGIFFKKVSRMTAGSKEVCAGESGSPIFVSTKDGPLLYGLISGIWDPITEGSAPCSKDFVVSPIATYETYSSKPIKSEQTPYKTILDACKNVDLRSPEGSAFYGLLVTLMDKLELDRRKSLSLFLKCEAIEPYWGKYLSAGNALSFKNDFDASKFIFLNPIENIEFSNQRSLTQISKLEHLKRLSLNGSKTGLNLNDLQTLGLKKVELKNLHSLSGLPELLAREEKLEEITLFDVEPRSGNIDLCWFEKMPNLKKLKIRQSRVDKNCSLIRSGLVLDLR